MEKPDGWVVILCLPNGDELEREPFPWSTEAKVEADCRAAQLRANNPTYTVRVEPYYD